MTRNIRKTAGEYAAEIIELIAEDVLEGIIPASIADFSETDLFVDRNEYFIKVGQHYDGTAESVAEVNTIHEEIDRRIRAGAMVAALLQERDAEVRRTEGLYGSVQRRHEFAAALAGMPA